MKKILNLILVPIICAVVISILFIAVALIPQSAIQNDASVSAEQLLSQPQRPSVINAGTSFVLDLYTDSQILMQSYNLNMDDPKSVFLNPKHISSENSENMALALNEVVNGGAENETNYVYYWMGFRIFIRPLLLFTSYNGIRKIMVILFWVLLFLALFAVAKKVNIKTAICLGIAVALVNPTVVSLCLQFSCLFLLTSIFVIYLCCFRKESVPVIVVFCIFGTLTQIFDFYTTPLITYGVPVLVLLEMNRTESTTRKLLTGVKCLFSWLWGYGFTWMLKLIFTTCFTGVNAFEKGFKAFAGRTGIVVVAEHADKYDALKALESVWHTVFPGSFGKILFCVTILAIFMCLALTYRKKGALQFLDCSLPLLVAVVPVVVWYIIAAQPTVIHAWFQYRSLLVAFFGVGMVAVKSLDLFSANKPKLDIS